MRNIKKFIMGATLVLFGAGMASADTISFSHVIDQTDTPSSTPFTLQKFNSALGTLTGIRLDVSANFVAELLVFGIPDPASYIASAVGSVNVSGPGSLDQQLFGETATQSGSIAANDVVDLPGLPAATTANIISTLGTPDSRLVFADYIYNGFGAVNVNMAFVGNSFDVNGSGDPGLQYGALGTAGGTVGLTYTYTPTSGTPEPATMALMGTALLGLGFYRKKLFNAK